MVQYSQVGRRLLPGRPPAPQTFKYCQNHRSGGAIPQEPESPVGKSQGHQTRHWLDPVRIRAASEGSMSLMVEVSLNTKRIRRNSEGSGEHDCTGKGVVRGSGTFDRGESGED